jgi:hypothetical protein
MGKKFTPTDDCRAPRTLRFAGSGKNQVRSGYRFAPSPRETSSPARRTRFCVRSTANEPHEEFSS